MSNLTICPLTDADCEAWNEYVHAAEGATFFHLMEWRLIFEQVLNHRTCYLIAKQGQEVVGVFPLVHVKSRLFGSALISVPFSVYGGVLANDALIKAALIERGIELGQQRNVDYVEVRELYDTGLDWETKDLYVTFRKPLLPTEEENFKAIPRKQRAMVRKAIDAGLTSEWDFNVDRFYAMYSESVRNLGTPVLAKKYYQALFDIFADRCTVLTILNDGDAVASVLNFYFKDQVLPFYGGGTATARACKANDFMYWELIRLSIAQGVRVFDFGRSKNGAGSYRFKSTGGSSLSPCTIVSI